MSFKSKIFLFGFFSLSLVFAGEASPQQAVQEALKGLQQAKDFGASPNSCSVEGIQIFSESKEDQARVSNAKACLNLYNHVCDSAKQSKRNAETSNRKFFYLYKFLVSKYPEGEEKRKLRGLFEEYENKFSKNEVQESFDAYLFKSDKTLAEKFSIFGTNSEVLSDKSELMKQILDKNNPEVKQSFNDLKVLKQSFAEVLNTKKEAVIAAGVDRNQAEAVFDRMKMQIDKIELDYTGAENICFLGQRNAYSQRRNGNLVVTLCPATLLSGKNAISGALAQVMAAAIDSCALDGMPLNAENNYLASMVFEPFRECLAQKAGAAKSPLLTSSIFSDKKKMMSFEKQQNQFAFTDGPHCAKPLCAEDLRKGANPKQRDQSNDAVKKYWAALALADLNKQFKPEAGFLVDALSVGCENTQTKKSPTVDFQKFYSRVLAVQPDFMSAFGCKVPPNQSCDMKLVSGFKDPNLPKLSKAAPSKSVVQEIQKKGSDDPWNIGTVDTEEGAAKPQPVQAALTSGMGSGGKLLSVTGAKPVLPKNLKNRNDSLKKALDSFNPKCMELFNEGTPFGEDKFAQWCSKKEGYVTLDLSSRVTGDHVVSVDGFNFELGCSAMCMCNQRQCHYPEASWKRDLDSSKKPIVYEYAKSGEVNQEALGADIDMLADGAESREGPGQNRYKSIAKACFLANPDLAVGTSWHEKACAQDPSKLVEQTRSIDVVGNLSGALIGFDCRINCNCGEGANCKAEIKGSLKVKKVLAEAEERFEFGKPYFAANAQVRLKKESEEQKAPEIVSAPETVKVPEVKVAEVKVAQVKAPPKARVGQTTVESAQSAPKNLIQPPKPPAPAAQPKARVGQATVEAVQAQPIPIPVAQDPALAVTLGSVTADANQLTGIFQIWMETDSKSYSQILKDSRPDETKIPSYKQVTDSMVVELQDLVKAYPDKLMPWDKEVDSLRSVDPKILCNPDPMRRPVLGRKWVPVAHKPTQGYWVQWIAEFDCTSSENRLFKGVRPYFWGPISLKITSEKEGKKTITKRFPENDCPMVQFLSPESSSIDLFSQYFRTSKDLAGVLKLDRANGKNYFRKISFPDSFTKIKNDCFYVCNDELCQLMMGFRLEPKDSSSKPPQAKQESPPKSRVGQTTVEQPSPSQKQKPIDYVTLAALQAKMRDYENFIEQSAVSFEWSDKHTPEMKQAGISVADHMKMKKLIDQAIRKNENACDSGLISIPMAWGDALKSSSNQGKAASFWQYEFTPECDENHIVIAAREVHKSWKPPIHESSGCSYFAFFDKNARKNYEQKNTFFQYDADLEESLASSNACRDGKIFERKVENEFGECEYTCYCESGLCGLRVK